MKKVFITLAIIIVLIIVTLMVIPVFFKSDILRLIEEKSSKYIQAELAIGDVHLSMFKNFPNLSVSLDNVVISKEETNIRDTLINIPLFEASVNLRSLISGKEIIINNILLKDCDFMPKVNAEGKANWDIMVPSDTTEMKTEETPVETKEEPGSETAIAFNNIEVRNLMLNYQDEQAQTFARIDAVNMANVVPCRFQAVLCSRVIEIVVPRIVGHRIGVLHKDPRSDHPSRRVRLGRVRRDVEQRIGGHRAEVFAVLVKDVEPFADRLCIAIVAEPRHPPVARIRRERRNGGRMHLAVDADVQDIPVREGDRAVARRKDGVQFARRDRLRGGLPVLAVHGINRAARLFGGRYIQPRRNLRESRRRRSHDPAAFRAVQYVLRIRIRARSADDAEPIDARDRIALQRGQLRDGTLRFFPRKVVRTRAAPCQKRKAQHRRQRTGGNRSLFHSPLLSPPVCGKAVSYLQYTGCGADLQQNRKNFPFFRDFPRTFPKFPALLPAAAGGARRKTLRADGKKQINIHRHSRWFFSFGLLALILPAARKPRL